MADCPKCDSSFSDGDEVFEVEMRDKDAPAPDLEYYTITVCSHSCVNKLSRSGSVKRIGSSKVTYDGS